MKKSFVFLLACGMSLSLAAQSITVSEARFSVGDGPSWKDAGFDDSGWRILSFDKDWTEQGISNDNAFAWYRLHVVIPSELKDPLTGNVVLDLGPVDDNEETFLNGVKVGATNGWNVPRRYLAAGKLVKWDKENVIAVRVYNGTGKGGFFAGDACIVKPVLSDCVALSLAQKDGKVEATLSSALKTKGTVEVVQTDVLTETILSTQEQKINLKAGSDATLSWPAGENTRFTVTYKDDNFGESITEIKCLPYILTPPAPATPRYNGPAVFGVRPGSPVIFRLAFSGDKPMKYEVEGLPEGVSVNPDNGVLSGSVAKKGEYPLSLKATNAKGSTTASFTLVVGEDKIALTPPMGWNSWNCWATSVSQEKVTASALAMLNRGLADYGYSYINIDDAWEAPERAADGSIVPNEKFPDMKALGDWLHSNGLRLGIYSSPGDMTCGGYLGTLGHEEQDARTWNEWGIDYLKYDWCGYAKVYAAQNDHSVASYIRPYLKMEEYLRQQPRDIFYSLCQYGMAEVWTWGHAVDANSWRTTGDITDTWASLKEIGFDRQPELYPYAGPGHWNDPDMLVVGKVGWSANLRDSRLTPDEQYTHISLWALLAANMLIGCPIEQIDDFTFNLLCNNEVNAVNQDVLGKQARRYSDEDGIQVWARPLADGTMAVGIFNLNETPVNVDLADALSKAGIHKIAGVRDLWRQQDIEVGSYIIPSHGVRLVKVQKACCRH